MRKSMKHHHAFVLFFIALSSLILNATCDFKVDQVYVEAPTNSVYLEGQIFTVQIVLKEADTTAFTVYSCQINDATIQDVEFSNPSGLKLSISYQLTPSNNNVAAGQSTIACSVKDGKGHVETITEFTVKSTPAVDLAPKFEKLTMNPNSTSFDAITRDQRILTIKFVLLDTSTSIEANGCTANGVQLDPATPEANGNSQFTLEYTYSASDTDSDRLAGQMPVSCFFEDSVGNVMWYNRSSAQESPLINVHDPVVTTVTLSPSSGYIGIGASLGIGFFGLDSMNPTVKCTINSEIVLDVFVMGNDGTIMDWSAFFTYTVAEGDPTSAENELQAICDITDSLGYTSVLNITQLAADKNLITPGIEAEKPKATSYVFVPDSGLLGIGHTVTLQVTADKPHITLGSVCTFNGATPSISFVSHTEGGYVYNLTYTILENDKSDKPLSVNCGLKDIAGNIGTITAETSTIDIDSIRPKLVSADVVGKRGGETTSVLTQSDEAIVTLTFTEADLVVVPDLCKMNTRPLQKGVELKSNGSNTDYVFTYTLISNVNAPDFTDTFPFTCQLKDPAGNTIDVTAVNGSVTGVHNSGNFLTGVSMEPQSGYLGVGKSLTINVTANRDALELVRATIAGSDVGAPRTSNVGKEYYYVFTYTVTENTPDWSNNGYPDFDVVIKIKSTEISNTVTQANFTNNGYTLKVIPLIPVVSSATAVLTNNDNKPVALPLSRISIIMITNKEGLTVNSDCMVNNKNVTSTWQVSKTQHTLTYTVTAGDNEWAAGMLPIKCSFLDAALNYVNVTSLDQNFSGDPIIPSIEAAISPSVGTAIVGTSIILTMSATEPVFGQCTLNLQAVALVTYDNITFTASYVVAAGHPSWSSGTIKLTCSMADAATNAAVITLAKNTLLGDTSVPSLTDITFDPRVGTVGIGTTISMNLTFSLDVSATVFINTKPAVSSTTAYSKKVLLKYIVEENDPNWVNGDFVVNITAVTNTGNIYTQSKKANEFNSTMSLSGITSIPTITEVKATSNSNTKWVGIGKKVTFTLSVVTVSKVLSVSDCLVNGKVQLYHTAQSFTIDNQAISFSYQVENGDPSWDAGALKLTCKVADSAAQYASTFPSLSSNDMIGMASLPEVKNSTLEPKSGLLGIGSVITASSYSTSNQLSSSPTISGKAMVFRGPIAVTTSSSVKHIRVPYKKNAENVAESDRVYLYQAVYVVAENDKIGTPEINFLLSDAAGNVQQAVAFDVLFQVKSTRPSVNNVLISPDVDEVLYGGQSLTLEMATSEADLQPVYCFINHNDVTSTFAISADPKVYTFIYTMKEEDQSWEVGKLPVNCSLVDAYGNAFQYTPVSIGSFKGTPIDTRLKGGAIAGITVAIVVAVIVLAIVLGFWTKKRMNDIRATSVKKKMFVVPQEYSFDVQPDILDI